MIGKWPTEDYMFDYSYSLKDDDHFYGLILDQDHDPELSKERIQERVKLIIPNFSNTVWVCVLSESGRKWFA